MVFYVLDFLGFLEFFSGFVLRKIFRSLKYDLCRNIFGRDLRHRFDRRFTCHRQSRLDRI